MAAGCFEKNLAAMVAVLARGEKSAGERKVGLELERFLIDAEGKSVPYAGEKGVHALLETLAARHAPEERVFVDGHLMGLAYTIETGDIAVPVTVSLEPAAQMELSAGPSTSAAALYQALLRFDEEVARALDELGLDARFAARGYNPQACAPEELELIPKDRYALMDAYLSKRGAYARDMMRATASTQVSLDYVDEANAMQLVRRATVLGPVFAFLFDNAPVFRGKPAPAMARSHIWRAVDADRCGTVPGSMEADAEGASTFSFEQYARWVAGVKPILFTDASGRTVSTGNRTAAELMGERELERPELLHLFSMVFPNVRLKGFVEIREMDALPPRLAAACASLVAAAVYCPDLGARVGIDCAALAEEDVERARTALEEKGWEAEPYGVPVPELAERLAAHALAEARDEFDAESAKMLGDLWASRKLPRDLAEGELPGKSA